MQRFTLHEESYKAIEKLGFKKPTEIQEEIIPLIKKGKSVIGQSKTGSGKTHAYLLPIFEKLDVTLEEVQAVIVAPTRELADQIFQAAIQINDYRSEPFYIRNYTGGTDKQKSINQLKRQPHLVVGTPGRINDLGRALALDVHTAKILIIDEADLTFDMGFLVDVDQIASRMPKDLQMCVFSATIPEKLKPFLNKYMENPLHIQIKSNIPTVEEITQYLIYEKSKSKIDVLLSLMGVLNPFIGMIFTNTRKNAEDVAKLLSEKGIRVGRIHGDLSPRERKKMMKQIRDLEFQYIVATDLAARGIDIPGVSHVINYELPTDLDFYIHRVGRTARAGTSGTSFSIVSHSDEEKLDTLEKRKIPLTVADIKNGEIVEIGLRHKRKSRVKKTSEIDETVKKLVKKPKKVKPGYKKKIQWEKDKIRRKELRKK